MDLTAHIKQEDGMFWAEVEELPGCFASGESIPVLIDALEEAISMCLTPAPQSPPVVTHVATLGWHVADQPLLAS